MPYYHVLSVRLERLIATTMRLQPQWQKVFAGNLLEFPLSRELPTYAEVL